MIFSFRIKTISAIAQIKQTGEPIVLTVNGKVEVVVQDAKSYQQLLEKIENLEAISLRRGFANAGIKQKLADIESGTKSHLEPDFG